MKWYKLILLGIGIGWVLGVCTFYIIYSTTQQAYNIELQDRVDVYINDVNSLVNILYKTGIIQDEDSFRDYLRKYKDLDNHIKKGQKVTFKKAMTYEEVFNAIYKSN